MVALARIGLVVVVALVASGCWRFPDSRYTDIAVGDAAADAGTPDVPRFDDISRPDQPVKPPDSGRDVQLPPKDSTVDTTPRPDTGPPADSTVDSAPRPDTTSVSCHKDCDTCAGGVCQRTCRGEGCKCPKDTPCKLTIICDSSDRCGKKIDCGTKGAVECTIKCSNNECTGELFCQATGACNIECTGSSCKNKIHCGGGRCDVKCTNGSCLDEIYCGSSCGCSVSCQGGSCTNKTHCKPSCNGSGKDCVAFPAPKCNSC